MSILRNTTNRENFLIVSKIFLQDTTLSINERGLLASMHSLPDNWEFSIAGMMKILPDGKTKLKTALDGLIEKGYITPESVKPINSKIPKCRLQAGKQSRKPHPHCT